MHLIAFNVYITTDLSLIISLGSRGLFGELSSLDFESLAEYSSSRLRSVSARPSWGLYSLGGF